MKESNDGDGHSRACHSKSIGTFSGAEHLGNDPDFVPNLFESGSWRYVLGVFSILIRFSQMKDVVVRVYFSHVVVFVVIACFESTCNPLQQSFASRNYETCSGQLSTFGLFVGKSNEFKDHLAG